MRYDLAVVIPTLNEAGNVGLLLERLETVLAGIAWEAIFVDDDSTDGTVEVLRRLSAERTNVRCLHRVGRRGLSSACVEGMLATGATYVAVMDADLQHDERLLPVMLERIRQDSLDVVVASRFAAGSSLGNFAAWRERLSRTGIWLSRKLLKVDISDPLSGFFLVRRALILEVVHDLSSQGFKILLDILASARRPLAYAEVSFQFKERHSGDSKLDTLVLAEFLILVSDKLFGKIVPIRFIFFVLVGLFGMLVHLGVLGGLHLVAQVPFLAAQAGATVIAMTVNFFLNNRFTYRDRRLKGLKFYRGLISFYLACTIGAVVNFRVAGFIFDLGAPWPLAGLLGAVISSVWNFGISSTITWSRR